MRYFQVIVIIFTALPCFAGSILDQYIRKGLENNLALRQKSFSYLQSAAAVNEAKGMFLPQISIEARYTRAGGGREIEFPVGTLMNPVYRTLNQMLSAIGEAPRFPENLPDQYIPFLREREHDTKLRLVQPLYQPALPENLNIKKEMKTISAREMELTGRHLACEIKTAYFNYLKTIEIRRLLEQIYNLLEENSRVNQSLFENRKVTEAALFRARAEMADLKRQQAEAEKNRIMAAAYFNCLLNRPMDAPIQTAEADFFADKHDPITLNEAESLALAAREELAQLETAVRIAGSQIGLSRSAFQPGISLVADYGFQGEEYSFSPKDDYWMASVVLSWNIFSGFRNRNKVQMAKLDRNRLEAQMHETRNHIKMETRGAWENLNVTRESVSAAAEQKKYAAEAFRMTERLYNEGAASQIEYMDALTVMTRAEAQSIISRYDLHIQMALLEKITAQYPLPDFDAIIQRQENILHGE